MRADLGTRRPRRRLALLASVAAVAAVCAGASATAFASSAQPAAKAPAAPGGPRLLSAGQTGTRSQVPWRKVGSGWVLAEYTQSTTKTAKPIKLELIDPAGGKYWLYTWRAGTGPWTLIGWSGDKTRALFSVSSGKMIQLVLATGRLSKEFRLPAGVPALGYTNPDGLNVLAADNGLVRYNLSGKFQARLIKGTQHQNAISAPNGASYVVSSGSGVDLVSNRGGVIRTLPVPGTNAKLGGCSPVRWWNSSTALVRCAPKSLSDVERLWLVPVSGAKPKALTPLRKYSGPDLGNFDGWRFPSGLYLEAAGGCGTVFIGKQAANGTVKTVTVPGSPGSNWVVATSGSRMLVQEFNACMPGSSLVWFNPATRAVSTVLRPAKGQEGVIFVYAYNRDGNQPASF